MAGSRAGFSASNYLQLASEAALKYNAGSWSQSVWYKASAYTDSHIFTRYTEFGPVLGWATASAHRPYTFNINGLSGVVTQGADSVALNTWRHILVTYTIGTQVLRVYDDGVLVATSAAFDSGLAWSSVAWSLGAANGGVAPFTVGRIGEAAIWNAVLTLADAQELAAGVPADELTSTTAPTGYWRMTGDSPEPDSIGSNHMVLHGTPTYSSTDGPPIGQDSLVFGDVTAHGSAVGGSSGDQFAKKFTLAGSSAEAVLKDIALRVSAAGAHAGELQLGVWRDVAGVPGALVGYGTLSPPAGAFSVDFYSVLGTGNAITLVDAAGVMPNGDYWIGPWQSAGTCPAWRYLDEAAKYVAAGGSAPSNPYGSSSDTSFAPVANATVLLPGGPSAAPVNTVAPAVTGTATIEATLTSDTGTWDNEPDTYAYQWYKNGVLQDGEDAATYELAGVNVGDTVYCTVVATNVIGDSDPAQSNTKTVIDVSTVAAIQAAVSAAWTVFAIPAVVHPITSEVLSPVIFIAERLTLGLSIHRSATSGTELVNLCDEYDASL